MRCLVVTAWFLLAPAAALAQHHGDTFGASPSSISPCKKVYAPAVENPGLRKVDFGVTTPSTPAREFFSQGLTLMYAFNYEDAMRAFRRAAKLDDQFAMAHWGIALAAGPNINISMDKDCQALAKAEIETAWQLARKRTVSQKESDFIDALRPRYSGFSHFEADYKVSMAALVAKVPYAHDPDALSLYAESVMDLRPWGLYDRAARPAIETQEVVDALQTAIAASRDHVGANHYLIHAVEGSLHPEAALRSAELLRTLVPEAGHLVHMPSHIFMRLGRYHDAADSNTLAAATDERMYGEPCGRSIGDPACLQLYYGHYLSHNLSFLTAATSMEGRRAEAIATALKLATHATRFVSDEVGLEHYVTVYWVTLVNFRQWERILREGVRTAAPCDEGCPGRKDCHLALAMYHWARGMALAANGMPVEAEKIELQAFAAERSEIFHLSWGNNTSESVLKIAENLLRARIATARGSLDAAIEALKVAVSLEDDLIYDEPPTWLYPVRQSLGGALLAAKRYGEAVLVFSADLEPNRNPENGRALFGLGTALDKLGDPTQAKKVLERYETAWKYADFRLETADLW